VFEYHVKSCNRG